MLEWNPALIPYACSLWEASPRAGGPETNAASVVVLENTFAAEASGSHDAALSHAADWRARE